MINVSRVLQINRASLTYVAMAVLFGTGIWGIFIIGDRIHAAIDIAGTWQLYEEDGGEASLMTIEQSGKYLSVTLGEEAPIDLRLVEQSRPKTGQATFFIVAEGNGATLRVSKPGPGDEYKIEFTNAERHRWRATWLTRSYVETQRDSNPGSAMILSASAHPPGTNAP